MQVCEWTHTYVMKGPMQVNHLSCENHLECLEAIDGMAGPMQVCLWTHTYVMKGPMQVNHLSCENHMLLIMVNIILSCVSEARKALV